MNVMKKAWEIAREGQKKFGGKVKEYFSQALKMAWSIVKNAMEKVEIGYQEVAKKNGVMYFVVNDVEGLEVSFLSTEKNHYNGKMMTKKDVIENFKRGTNNKTGKAARLYDVAINSGDIEITLGDVVEVIKNAR
ncbi:hypothetical protein J1P26_17125 [Neobacillus sp. MM2021_6]|uniref:hypothetical protein n=1 Tax=Bacillaceae TaxID=186817 RepID=UPI00140BAA58|nr:MULTISPECIES: hypothetical protein [Bacillaceae]MBO0961430.1 hypothetical protein [Neobacillus sp. MM2021_6]NHC19535.1 hypothetical protein [Bacillus sp. MM2020_4]